MPDPREVTLLLVPEKTAAKLLGVSNAMLVAGRFRKQHINRPAPGCEACVLDKWSEAAA